MRPWAEVWEELTGPKEKKEGERSAQAALGDPCA